MSHDAPKVLLMIVTHLWYLDITECSTDIQLATCPKIYVNNYYPEEYLTVMEYLTALQLATCTKI